MTKQSKTRHWTARAVGVGTLLGVSMVTVMATVTHNENITPDTIWGGGNVNGSFTVDRSNGVELGLRGKLRFDENNQPQNTFNSNGDGTFTFPAGIAPGGFGFQPNSSTTPVWSFEWSINSNHDGSSAYPALDDLTYTLDIDFDPSAGTNNLSFDPIHSPNPNHGQVFWDHGIGTNATANSAGVEATDATNYATLISSNNVAQNSWNYEFFNEAPFNTFDPTVAGLYDITLTAFDGANPVASATITIETVVNTELVLSTPDDWCADKNVGDSVTVDIDMVNADLPVAGGEFLIAYDADALSFVSVVGGVAPFDTVFFTLTNPFGTNDGTGIDYVFFAIGAPLNPNSTTADSLMATLTFTLDSEVCSAEDLVAFDPGSQPIGTYLTNEAGQAVPHTPTDLPAQTVDDTAPVITCPPDINVYADAGVCEADVDLFASTVEPFDDAVVIGPTQAPGVWYTDRYAPFGFTSAVFLGDNRLKHSIDASDCSPCRGPSFSSGFYDTQGRKYDTPGNTKMSIDLYIPLDWATTGRRMAGFWGTGFNSLGVTQSFPIIEFTSSPDDSGVPRFRGWDNAWVDMGLPTGFVYDAWYTLEIELVAGTWVYTVGDLSLTVTATDVGGTSVEIGNVILQGHNNTAGVTYDIYWDNFAYGVGPAAEDNCSLASVTGQRSDSLPLTDPYPLGTTTITWTATDGCGNFSSCTQDVTVDSNSEVVVDLAYDGVLDASVDRCIEFLFEGTDGPQTVNQVVTFTAAGEADDVVVLVPCGEYDCLSVSDALHTLVSSVDLTDSGSQYTASATGSDAMVGGNYNGDIYIDILDFGVFVGQYADSLPVNTNCSTPAPHADITGDGTVATGDFSFIQINFLGISDSGCTMFAPLVGGAQGNPHLAATNNRPLNGPVTSISLRQLHRLGMSELAVADLNHDQWLDEQDIAAFIQGARP